MDGTIEVKSGSNLEVKLHEDLVASKTGILDENLMELIYGKKPEYFTMNMVNVEMVDSSGISLLLALHNYLKESQCPMILINLSDDIYDLFIRMRIDTHITMRKESRP